MQRVMAIKKQRTNLQFIFGCNFTSRSPIYYELSLLYDNGKIMERATEGD